MTTGYNPNEDNTCLVNNDDCTRLLNNEADNDATQIVNEENAYLQEEQKAQEPQEPLKKANRSKGAFNASNIAAAGIGVVAGAAAGAAVGAGAANIEQTDLAVDDATAAGDKATDAATGDNATVHAGAESIHNAAAEDPLPVSGPNPADAAATVHAGAESIHNAAADDVEPATEDVVVDETYVDPNSDIHVAHVDDSMSFSQAFAAARSQVGAGGCFTWHGRVYGTYYENEWNAMTPAEQHDFQMAATETGHSAEHYDNSNDLAVKPVDVTDADITTPTDDDIAYVDPEPVSDDEVRVLGVSEVQDGEGNSYQAAILDVSGRQGMLVDINDDGVYEVITGDFNGDGQITEDEIGDVSSCGITTEDVQQQYEYQNQSEAQFDIDEPGFDDPGMDSTADFDNTVDVSDFA